MPRRVVIAGGGLAGLAAAVALGQRGFGVTLFESRPRLGGRASSVVDPATLECIDNCQHVALGCCTNFLRFCEIAGLAGYFRRETKLTFLDRQGGSSTLCAGLLPAPWHLAFSFARLKYLNFAEILRLARGLWALARTREDYGGSFLSWLVAHRQPPNLIDRFWQVVLVSALSESLDRIDLGHARKVFVDGFLANRTGWEVWLPTVPLDTLYGRALSAWFDRHSVSVQVQSGVERVLSCADGSSTTGVELRSGARVDADAVIIAVPHYLVSGLLPNAWHERSEFKAIERLETAPITSVHIWFDRPITQCAHAVLVGRLGQWLFSRSAIRGQSAPPAETAPQATGPATGWYYQVVISASREVANRPHAETTAAVLAELCEIFAAARSATVLNARVITEHRAVVSMLPGVEEFRPRQQTSVEGLFLAGDYTRTGWPSTMEGAVRSGFLAAQGVLARYGLTESLLAPDLPRALLSKVLLRL